MTSVLLDCTHAGGGTCFFFGYFGCASALAFSNIGAAYGIAKSGVGISTMGIMNPQLVMRNIVPVIMASILGIYGLIICVILVQNINHTSYTEYKGYAHCASGLSVGLSCLTSGISVGVAGDAGVRANGQQQRLFVPMILILVFASNLGLYGLIVAIVLSQA